MLVTRRAKSLFCVRRSRLHQVSRFSILIPTLPGLNERKPNIMKLHLPSKHIVTPAGRRTLFAPAPRNRDFSRRGFLGASMTLAAAGVLAAKAGDRSTSDPGPANPGLEAQNADPMG